MGYVAHAETGMYSGHMAKHKSKDVNVTAFEILKATIDPLPNPLLPGKPLPVFPLPTKPANRKSNSAAVALGRLGGVKGGKARAVKLSPARRSQIAKKAARARWSS